MSHRTGSPSPCGRWSHSPTPLSRRQSAPGKCSCNAAAPLHSIRLGLRQLAHAASEDRGSQRRHCRESSWSLTPDRARDDALEQLEHSPIRVSNPTQSAKARPSGRVTGAVIRSHPSPTRGLSPHAVKAAGGIHTSSGVPPIELFRRGRFGREPSSPTKRVCCKRTSTKAGRFGREESSPAGKFVF